MGVRLSFGRGPLRASVPLTSGRPRFRRKSSDRRPSAANQAQDQDELRARVRAGVQDVRRSRDQLEQHLASLRASVKKLDSQMRAALEAGREDLATDASRRKLAIQQQLIDLESEFDQLLAMHATLEAAARRIGVEA
jgi:phage shock protein A